MPPEKELINADEAARLWELYQSFEYDGAYDPAGKGGWVVSARFQFGDGPDDDTDIFFILTRHGIHTQDGEDAREWLPLMNGMDWNVLAQAAEFWLSL